MILDQSFKFADAQDATNVSTSGTVNSTNVADLDLASLDLGGGTPLRVVITGDVDFTSGGTPSVYFQVVSDASGTVATNGTASFHGRTRNLALADLVAGELHEEIILPPGDYERYLAVQIVWSGAAITAGSFSANLALDEHNPRIYPGENG